MVVAVTFAHFDEQIAGPAAQIGEHSGWTVEVSELSAHRNSPPVGWWQR